MEPHGLQGILTHQIVSMTSPMETVNSLWWVILEPSSPHRTEPLGLQGLQYTMIMISLQLPPNKINYKPMNLGREKNCPSNTNIPRKVSHTLNCVIDLPH